MTQYRWLLLDADNTLFDFNAAEEFALTRTLIRYGVSPTAEVKTRYRAINSALWLDYDHGKISQDALGPKRFQLLFEMEEFPGQPGDPGQWSDFFLSCLSECSTLMPGAEKLCHRLSDRYILALTTNGISHVQRRRLQKSPLARYFGDRVFISGEMGCRKPERAYFDTVLAALGVGPGPQRTKALVIGDSLSSDIKGAFQSRLDSVWVRSPGAKAGVVKPTYEVDSLAQLAQLLGADRYVNIPL